MYLTFIEIFDGTEHTGAVLESERFLECGLGSLAVTPTYIFLLVEIDLYLIDGRFCFLEGRSFLLFLMLFLGGGAGDGNDNVLVTFLVDLCPLLIDTLSLSLLSFVQLCVTNQQFRTYVCQSVQFYAHKHLLVRSRYALPGSNGEEDGVGDLQLCEGGSTLKMRKRSVVFSRQRALKFSVSRKEMALAETIILKLVISLIIIKQPFKRSSIAHQNQHHAPSHHKTQCHIPPPLILHQGCSAITSWPWSYVQEEGEALEGGIEQKRIQEWVRISRMFFAVQIEWSYYFSKLMSNQQVSAPIGIDLGSWTSKIAVAKRGGVEIITNEANFRETPCVVGYGPAERNIGEAGNIKMKSNFKDTVSYPSRFLGLAPDHPMLKAEKKFCPAKCTSKDNRIAFEIKYQGQSEAVFPEQVFAAYINKLKFILQKNNFDNKSGVLAVPTYLTQQERKAVYDAARIAEFNITRLLNESTAIGLDYGMFRKNELDANNARNVLFIDFGHSKLSLFACSFTNAEMNVLEQEHCRHIGCRDIDFHLYQFYRSIFEKSSGGSDLAENRKAIVKLMEQVERQRKILSGNSEHDLNIEYLMDECDLQYTMTREKFEEVSQPIFKGIAQVLVRMRETLKGKNIPLHSIELIGGGSRIPAFVALVKQVFGVEPSRTLNSSESVARGCALMAAIKSPLFRVSDYSLHERVYYGVKFYWNFVEGEKYLGLDASLYPEKQGKYIYEAGAKVPTSKTIKFTRKEAIEVLIEYEPSVNGFGKHIGYFVTKPQNPTTEVYGVTFKIRYTEDGLVLFEECQLVEEWFEETKIPKKKETKKEEPKKEGEAKKEGEPQKMEEEEFEIKKTKKEKYTAIKFDSNTFDNFTSKDIETFFTIESTMVNQDRLILETYEKKNELESQIYRWKSNLTSSHQEYSRPEEIPDIIAFLERENEWLYSDGQNSNRGTYNERINGVKNKVAHIAKRYDNFDLLVHEVKSLGDSLAANTTLLNSLDKKYEHITPEERQEGFSLIQKVRGWVAAADEKQRAKPRWEDLVITPQQAKDQAREVSDKVKKIMGKPAPPPPAPPAPAPKEEPKPEEKKAEKMEEEAKPEKMDVEP